MKTFSLLFVLLLVFSQASGQHSLLALQKKNPRKNAYYEAGDELIFYRREKRGKTKDRILALKDSSVVFQGYSVPIDQITALYVDDKTRWWLRYKPAQLLLIGGTGYLLLSAANGHELYEETLVIGGSLVGLGLIFRLLIPNKIKIRGSTKLRILTL